ncbi:ribosomal protein S2, flavodoxin-like domain-containing protein [Terfezia claveryi]|nr:ribosomal protein S2, flavodoxin-like domain-containing protein [Terfezia claveryi]
MPSSSLTPLPGSPWPIELTFPGRSLSSARYFSRSSLSAQQYANQPPMYDINAYGGYPHPGQPGEELIPRPDQLKREWEQFHHFKSTTGQLGTKITPHYSPSLLIHNPPSPRDITLSLLLASQAHLGHSTSLWNPTNQRYILGVRQGIHIICLETIAAHLRRAAKIVEGVSEKGGLILFVGTRPGQDRAVVKAAKLAGGCHLFERWTPGAITNASQILGHGKVVEMDMRDRVKVKSPIVAAQEPTEHESPKSEDVNKPVKPDLVVCLNPLENYILLHECGLYGIPTIGIIDTDADPTWVTYPIPANDDSLRAVHLITGILGRAAEEGRNRRIRRAEREAMEAEAAAAQAAKEMEAMADTRRDDTEFDVGAWEMEQEEGTFGRTRRPPREDRERRERR